MSDNVTPIKRAPQRNRRRATMTDTENEAMLAISQARAIANVLQVGAENDSGTFMEDLSWASLSTLMQVLIEKLDLASQLIERRTSTTT